MDEIQTPVSPSPYRSARELLAESERAELALAYALLFGVTLDLG